MKIKTDDLNMERKDIINMILDAGVVGAGGAGFPTHVKLSAKADVVIANGAECEPLLESDRHLMLREARKVIEGLKLAMEACGAEKGVVAIKKKHEDIVETLNPIVLRENKIELFLLDNFYPAGDEHVLVYEATGRVVPMAGIPIDVGVVVSNVYTLAMIYDAVNGKAFTHRYVTVAGAVKRPAVAKLPIGMPVGEAIEKVGCGPTVRNFKVIMGGPMMGKMEEDMEKPILKTTSGIIVLPEDSKLVAFKVSSIYGSMQRAKSVCCQCSFCTDMCPRHLLGHRLKPHQIMRSIPGFSAGVETVTAGITPETVLYSSFLCSECSLCGYFACTMGLLPNKVNGYLKGVMAKNRIKPDFKKAEPYGVNPFREWRKVPTDRLVGRLGLSEYDLHLPFLEEELSCTRLRIPLKQHAGAPSVPVVKKGDMVKAGTLIAKIADNSLGANIHSPVDGVVGEVSEVIVLECRN